MIELDHWRVVGILAVAKITSPGGLHRAEPAARSEARHHARLYSQLRIRIRIENFLHHTDSGALMTRSAKPIKDWLVHYRELIGVWRRGGRGREDGEDAMHDTVLGMLENGARAIYDPRAYMARGTSNRLVSWHRHVHALEITSLDLVAEAEHPRAAGAEHGVGFQQLADALSAALEELPVKCRQVYIMCRLEGWSHTEIAQEMGLSRSMVEKYMTRSLRHINDRLQHHAPH